MKDVDRVTEAPQVHLADIEVAWHPGQPYTAVATFDLEPARLVELELTMPPQTTLVQAFVAELPTAAESLGENRWRLPLGPEQWPQRVEILFEGPRPHSAWESPPSLAAPELVGVPVLRHALDNPRTDGTRKRKGCAPARDRQPRSNRRGFEWRTPRPSPR